MMFLSVVNRIDEGNPGSFLWPSIGLASEVLS
jgi:hypothetical protein